MMSFIHNESEMTTLMGYSFKTKSTKPKDKKATKIRTSFFESQAADYYISTGALDLCAKSLKQLFL